jgi:hypothetical protein
LIDSGDNVYALLEGSNNKDHKCDLASPQRFYISEFYTGPLDQRDFGYLKVCHPTSIYFLLGA